MQEQRKQIETLPGTYEKRERDSRGRPRAVLKFSDEMDLLHSEYTDYKHNNLLRHCTLLAENVEAVSEALEVRQGRVRE